MKRPRPFKMPFLNTRFQDELIDINPASVACLVTKLRPPGRSTPPPGFEEVPVALRGAFFIESFELILLQVVNQTRNIT